MENLTYDKILSKQKRLFHLERLVEAEKTGNFKLKNDTIQMFNAYMNRAIKFKN